MDQQFKEDLKVLSSDLRVRKRISSDRKRFDYRNYPLVHNQAIYVLSLSEEKVTYTKNIDLLLGYEESEFSYNSPFELIHPDDYPTVRHIVKSTLLYSAANGISHDSVLYLTYRIKKKDGTYIRIQRTSGISRLKRNRSLDGNYSIIQDISYMNLDNTVRWRWDSPSTDLKEYRKFVSFNPEEFLTPRQVEVYNGYKNGKTESEIAEILGVKPSTIKTLRKRMLSRLNCHSVSEMIEYFENSYPEIDLSILENNGKDN